MNGLFFNGWDNLQRVLIMGVLGYASLILILRISGKRTLSKMNAFDLVVTVSLGSTLATTLLSKDISLAEGALAFAVLIGLQSAVTWSSVRAHWVHRLVTGEPRLLLYEGHVLTTAMLRARVTHEELCAAIRAAGFLGFGDVEAVVLETDGSFSVLGKGKGEGHSSLDNVPNHPPEAERNAGGKSQSH